MRILLTLLLSLLTSTAWASHAELSWEAPASGTVQNYRITSCDAYVGSHCQPIIGRQEGALLANNVFTYTIPHENRIFIVTALDANGFESKPLASSASSASISLSPSPPRNVIIRQTSGSGLDVTAPSVTLVAPANAAEITGDSTTLSADVTDAVGVVDVVFRLGTTTIGTDTTANTGGEGANRYSVTLNTTQFTNATYTWTATGRDAAGNSASASRTLTINRASPPPSSTITAPTQFSQWETHLYDFGRYQCNLINTNQGITWDYDPAYVYYQIYDYTVSKGAAESTFLDCANKAADSLRTGYLEPVLAQNTFPAEHVNYTRGQLMRYKRTGLEAAKTVTVGISTTGIASDSANPDWFNQFYELRAVANAFMNHMDAEETGATPRARRDAIYDTNMNNQVNQVTNNLTSVPPFVWKTNPYPSAHGNIGLQAFMAGMQMHATIVHVEENAANVTTAKNRIKAYLDTIYNYGYTGSPVFNHPNGGKRDGVAAGTHTNTGVCDPAASVNCAEPGLNLLIAPAFWWYYYQTGDTTYRDRGDEFFNYGVAWAQYASTTAGVEGGGYLWSPKQFQQQYYWSIKGLLKWRMVPCLTC